MHSRSIAIAAAAALFSVVPATAQKEPILIQADVPTATVSYADLNIGSLAGRHTLEGRVARAATRLCMDNRRAPLDELIEQRRCLSTAVRQAGIDIDLAVARSRSQLASTGTIRVAAK
jgi:UrcA family protein